MRFKEILVAPPGEYGFRKVNGQDFDLKEAEHALGIANQIVSNGEKEVSKIKSLIMDNRNKDLLSNLIT